MKILLRILHSNSRFFLCQTPLSLVRWPLISMDEFINMVGPSNVLDPVQLMDLMKDNQETKSPRIPSNFFFIF